MPCATGAAIVEGHDSLHVAEILHIHEALIEVAEPASIVELRYFGDSSWRLPMPSI